MSIASRLRKLEEATGRAYTPENCPGPPTVVINACAGEPFQAIPDDAPRCPLCGEVHVLRIVEEQERLIHVHSNTIAKAGTSDGSIGAAVLPLLGPGAA